MSDLAQFVPPQLAFVEQQLTEVEQEGVNRALEEKISRKHRLIDTLYAQPNEFTESGVYSPLYATVYRTFIAGKMNRLERHYSKAQNFIAKQQIGDSIYALLDSMEAAQPYLDVIPDYVQKVDKAYTEKTFDPYTFSYDFTKRIKKELYEKAAGQLYRHMLSRLTEEQDYRQLPTRARAVVRLFKRLLELSEESTRKMERQLRRVEEPEEIKSIIGLA